jgi:hypothetical protein
VLDSIAREPYYKGMKTTHTAKKSATYVAIGRYTYSINGTTELYLRIVERKDLIPSNKWEACAAIVAAATKHVAECMQYDCPVGKIGMGR